MSRTDLDAQRALVDALVGVARGYGNSELLRPGIEEVLAAQAPVQGDIQPEPFIVGNQYRTQGGRLVRFLGVSNEGTTYETMFDELGHHRYTRRDFGRNTGAPWSDDCVPPLYAAIAAARKAAKP